MPDTNKDKPKNRRSKSLTQTFHKHGKNLFECIENGIVCMTDAVIETSVLAKLPTGSD